MANVKYQNFIRVDLMIDEVIVADNGYDADAGNCTEVSGTRVVLKQRHSFRNGPAHVSAPRGLRGNR